MPDRDYPVLFIDEKRFFMDERSQFTEGKIVPKLIRFALPVLLAMCVQSLYGAVDLLIVGQFGTPGDVSAVSIGGQIMMMVTMMLSGLAMGTTILLGQAIGSGEKKLCGNIIGTSILFFLIVAAGITVILEVLVVVFTRLLDTPPEAFDQTIAYTRICGGGTILITAYNLLGSIFRGIGDSKTPLISVIIACIVNILGDLLFVAVFKMAAAGAAIATVLAQGVSVVICILIVKRKGLPFEFSKNNIRLNGKLTKRILNVGLPIALQDALVSVSFLIINGITNGLGVIASAGVGVAGKICNFVMLVPSAFAQSLSAFVAQNVGAGKKQRARQAMLCGMVASILIGIIMAYVSFFHGDLLAAIFSKDKDVIFAAADYLKAYAIDTFMVSFLFCFIGYFNGCGRTTFVMIQGLIGALVVRVPASFIMANLENVTLFKIGLATPISTTVQMLCCVTYFAIMLKKEKKQTLETL